MPGSLCHAWVPVPSTRAVLGWVGAGVESSLPLREPRRGGLVAPEQGQLFEGVLL